jgi:uncharacterized protein YndB with AHSA1/START domain
VIKNKKLVWTNAMLPDFRPSAELKHPDFFMTAIISFEPQGKKTKYTAIVRHKNEADRKKHEEMRFHEGWGIALDQLVALYSNS